MIFYEYDMELHRKKLQEMDSNTLILASISETHVNMDIDIYDLLDTHSNKMVTKASISTLGGSDLY